MNKNLWSEHEQLEDELETIDYRFTMDNDILNTQRDVLKMEEIQRIEDILLQRKAKIYRIFTNQYGEITLQIVTQKLENFENKIKQALHYKRDYIFFEYQGKQLKIYTDIMYLENEDFQTILHILYEFDYELKSIVCGNGFTFIAWLVND